MSSTSYEPGIPQVASPIQHAPSTRRWSATSIAALIAAWLVLQIGGLFSPGLLDDVDSIYIQIAREMLQRHDFVTPTIDGIRFFDKPPLMYWMAAGSMHIFGIHDWAARLPLALGVLALLFAVYALGIRLYASVSSPGYPDRAGLYAALAMATSIGPYLYTRFYIPDILIALWMTLSIHLFLIALDRIRASRSTLLPMIGFGAVLALSVLTKGLIGIVFPIGFVVFYLAFTRQFRLLLKLQLVASTASFLIIAAPWHILAALRNPAIPMPAGLGLPARAGWAWFYLYNEHVARFLGRRIPHDYGQVPIPLFWALLVLWLVPWAAFLPAALLDHIRTLRASRLPSIRFDSDIAFSGTDVIQPSEDRQREAALTLFIWAGLVLGFFTLSSRQEYYHLPALPALALMVGGLLAAGDRRVANSTGLATATRQCLRASLFFLVPLGSLLFLVCGYFALTAPTPPPGIDLNHLLSSNPAMYNLSLGHVFDLTSEAMGFFRGPLLTVALCMAALGPGSHLFRSRGRTLIANIIVAGAMCGVLMAAHEGLTRFYPTLGSKDLALAIDHVRKPGDLILLDGELTSGSTLLFYTGQPVHLVNGRINGPWFGSFWPDAPHIFEDETSLHKLWAGPQRIFLFTYDPMHRTTDLQTSGPVITIASSGGKTILTNRP
jgi:4-amino-4-deoxy-L-arabinose transferase-like glycosyltransferase